MKPSKPQSRYLRLGVTVLPRKLRQATTAKRAQTESQPVQAAEPDGQLETIGVALDSEAVARK